MNRKTKTVWNLIFKRINTSLKWAGLSFFEQSENLLLGREFGGIEISGGQWQRLALARSYYRQRPVVFLTNLRLRLTRWKKCRFITN